MIKASLVSVSSNETVVVVCSAPRFMESDALDGRRKISSSLPQYLIKAILGWAMAVACPNCAACWRSKIWLLSLKIVIMYYLPRTSCAGFWLAANSAALSVAGLVLDRRLPLTHKVLLRTPTTM